MSRAGRPRRIHVAVAVIERSGRVLVCRRLAGRSLGGYWEFPGGKRHRGEAWVACLKREMREELGVEVRSVIEFDRFSFRYPAYDVSFRVFRCAIARGRPRPLDAQAMRWVPRRRLRRYRFPPANARLIERLAPRLLRHAARGTIQVA